MFFGLDIAWKILISQKMIMSVFPTIKAIHFQMNESYICKIVQKREEIEFSGS